MVCYEICVKSADNIVIAATWPLAAHWAEESYEDMDLGGIGSWHLSLGNDSNLD